MSPRILGLMVTVLACSAYAETVPERGAVDPRIRVVEYKADELYRLHGWVGQEIHLEFAPEESFVAMTGGDLDAIAQGSERNSLSLKPRVALVDTNLTIITTARYYHIQYSAAVRRAHDDPTDAIFSLRFMYPQDEAAKSRDLALRRLDERLSTEAGRVTNNRDYGFCGHRSLKPVAAYDNGVQTHLRFSEQTEWPAVFVREDDGSEALVNFSVEGRELIIHRIAHQFVLRRGRLVGCVVNRGFTGSAVPADSGTVSPQVQRHTRGAQHD